MARVQVPNAILENGRTAERLEATT